MPYVPSDKCVQKLSNLESFRQFKYKDGGGLWTIGLGARCSEHDYPNGITLDEAKAKMKCALAEICALIEKQLPGLMQHQIDALCLLCYNLGWYQFSMSPIYEYLKERSYLAFLHWVLYVKDAKGQVEAGLVTRRSFEIALFIFGWTV